MLDGERGEVTVRQAVRTWVAGWEALPSGSVWSRERRNGRGGWTNRVGWAV